jgi:ATP-dependent Clp protease ATP-binding subunit ClpX
MEQSTFYGLAYKDSFYDEIIFRKLAKSMFLSPSCTPDNVLKILNHFEKLLVKDLIDYIETLDSEAIWIKVNCKSDNRIHKHLISKLQSWLDFFGCTLDNVEEFLSYYSISDEISLGLKIFSPSKESSPKKIKAELDKFVISQENAKKVLSTALYTHLLRSKRTVPLISYLYKNTKEEGLELPNPNLILIGSSGTGKSFMLKTIAKRYDIIFLKVDCTSLVASGYVGNSLNDILYSFYDENYHHDQRVEKSIIFFDEFDKLSEKHIGRSGSVGGVEMQQEFLNLIEDRMIRLRPPRGSDMSSVMVNFSNCMLVFGGSFDGIKEIVNKRLKADMPIGFNKSNETGNNNSISILHEDLVKFGIIPELVGRINHIVELNDHTPDTIIKILKNSADSPLKKYENYFSIHLDRLIIEEDVYPLIAKEIISRKTGARAITSVLNELLKDFLYEKPNLIKEDIIIDKEYFFKMFENNN